MAGYNAQNLFPSTPLKRSAFAKNRMLSVPFDQVGPALPLVAATTASCSKFSSLHCTVRPRMKTASAIRGRHEVPDTTLNSSSATSPSHTNHIYHLLSQYNNPMYCYFFFARILFFMCRLLMNKHFSIQFNSTKALGLDIETGVNHPHTIPLQIAMQARATLAADNLQ